MAILIITGLIFWIYAIVIMFSSLFRKNSEYTYNRWCNNCKKITEHEIYYDKTLNCINCKVI